MILQDESHQRTSAMERSWFEYLPENLRGLAIWHSAPGLKAASGCGNQAPLAHYLYGRTRLLYLMQSK
jgi:hypothetical protein